MSRTVRSRDQMLSPKSRSIIPATSVPGQIPRFDVFPYLLLVPTVVVVAVFLAYPLVRLLTLSFEEGKLTRLAEEATFVGLRHYIYILTDIRFLYQLVNTIIYTVGTVFGSYLVGMAGALLLDARFIGRNIVRVIVLTPWAVSVTVTCLIWMWILDTQFGILNAALMELGITETRIGWLHTKGWAMFSVILVTTWRTAPFACLMILAGLQSIPRTSMTPQRSTVPEL